MKKLAVLIIVVLALGSFGNLSGVAADDDTPRVIGKYDHVLGSGDLTEEDLVSEGESLLLDVPELTTAFRIDDSYLKGRLGEWAADREFVVSDDQVEFAGGDTRFVPFAPGPDPQFTFGSLDSIAFVERPMWVSTEHENQSLKLEMDDGNTQDQEVFLSAHWLASNGILMPLVTHEDGHLLDAHWREGAKGYTFRMPHFSFVIITDGIDVRGRVNGVDSPHVGEKRWDASNQTLEIDVGPQVSDYELLVESQWLYDRIPNPVVENRSWSKEALDGKVFFVSLIHPNETPLAVIFKPATWSTFEYEYNYTEFRERVESGLSVEIPLEPGKSVNVTLTSTAVNTTFQLNTTNETGTFENVSLLNDDQAGIEVILTASPTSLAGQVCLEDVLYDLTAPFATIDPVSDVLDILMRVVYRYNPVACEDPENSPYPNDPPGGPERDFYMDAYLDASFESGYGLGAGTHVVEAAHELRPVFAWYTGNFLAGGGVSSIADLYTGSNCDLHLEKFRDWLDLNDLRNGRTVHVLVTGNTALDCTGLGNAATEGTLTSKTDSINLGLNRPSDGYYGGDSTVHLGLLISQEIAHNMGAIDHVCATPIDTTSIMCDDTQWDMRDFWLHYYDSDYNPNNDPAADHIVSATGAWDQEERI